MLANSNNISEFIHDLGWKLWELNESNKEVQDHDVEKWNFYLLHSRPGKETRLFNARLLEVNDVLLSHVLRSIIHSLHSKSGGAYFQT